MVLGLRRAESPTDARRLWRHSGSGFEPLTTHQPSLLRHAKGLACESGFGRRRIPRAPTEAQQTAKRKRLGVRKRVLPHAPTVLTLKGQAAHRHVDRCNVTPHSWVVDRKELSVSDPNTPHPQTYTPPPPNPYQPAIITYAVFAASFLVAPIAIGALIYAYVERGKSAEIDSHLTFLIRTFWIGLGVMALGVLTTWLLIGFVILLGWLPCG